MFFSISTNFDHTKIFVLTMKVEIDVVHRFQRQNIFVDCIQNDAIRFSFNVLNVFINDDENVVFFNFLFQSKIDDIIDFRTIDIIHRMIVFEIVD